MHTERNEPLMPYEIIVDGAAQLVGRKTNYRLTIDRNPIDLPFRLFRVFAILALRRDLDSGWVDYWPLMGFEDRITETKPVKAELFWVSVLARKYASRTRTYLQAADWRCPGGVDGAWHVIETKIPRGRPRLRTSSIPEEAGFYRLVAKPETIRISPELVRFDDRVVAREAESFLVRQADRLMCPGEVAASLQSNRKGRR